MALRAALAVGSLALIGSTGCARRANRGALAARTDAGPRPVKSGELPAEPQIPPACTTLVADKAATNDNLAEADERKPDTARIQGAIDGCGAGRSVVLKGEGAKNAFLSGPIKMAKGVTLVIEANTTLFASRNPRDYDVGASTCGTDEHDDSSGCRPLINVDKVSGVGVMGEGVIDGRGGEPMLGTTTTWWDVAQDAKAKNVKHSNPRLIDIKKASNFTLYKVTLRNSPKFHVVINSQGFVVWGVKVITPSRATNSQGKRLTPYYARNTDGIDPSSASDGYIVYSNISVGDDQIAIKGGNSGPTTNLTIAHNHFGAGHGMSIGSETNGGVSMIRVFDLSIDGDIDTGGAPGADLNGIRIKSDPSRGGEVTDVSYTDVCIRDLVNPIILTPHYSKIEGGSIPDYKRIVLTNVHALKSADSAITPVVTLMGYDAEHILDVTLNNVIVDGIAPTAVKAAFADITLGPGAVNFTPAGEEVALANRTAGAIAPNPCTDKFVKLPVP